MYPYSVVIFFPSAADFIQKGLFWEEKTPFLGFLYIIACNHLINLKPNFLTSLVFKLY